MNGLTLLGRSDEELIRMAERREAVKRLDRTCPSCGSEQVQLVSWYTDDIKLRCRKCKFGFEVKL